MPGKARSVRPGRTRAAIEALDGMIDTGAATAAWEAALRAGAWDGPPCWVHADLMPGNLLVDRGRLSGVIDFATAGVGDPACDLIPAWNLLPAGARRVFRAGLDVDDATWAITRMTIVRSLLIPRTEDEVLRYYGDRRSHDDVSTGQTTVTIESRPRDR